MIWIAQKERPKVIHSSKHFSWWKRTFGGVEDYGYGYLDADEALNAAESKLTSRSQMYTRNGDGWNNTLNRGQGTLGIYIYYDDGYYWVGNNTTGNIASLGCATCYFSSSNMTEKPGNVYSLTAIIRDSGCSPLDSTWESMAAKIPGPATVLYDRDPYKRKVY